MKTRLRCWLGLVLLLGAGSAWPQGVFGELFSRPRPVNRDMAIDTQLPTPFQSTGVPNGSAVTIRVRKRPVDKCSLDTKREEIKEEANPLASILGILFKSGVAAGAPKRAFTPPKQCLLNLTEAPPPAGDQEAAHIEFLMLELGHRLGDASGSTENYRDSMGQLAKLLQDLAECKNDICAAQGAFDQEKQTLLISLHTLLNAPLPVTDSADFLLATLKEAVVKRAAKPKAKDAAWIEYVEKRLDCHAATLELVKHNLKALAAAREELEKFRDALAAHVTQMSFPTKLPAESDAKITGQVTCTNYFTGQPSISPISFEVAYQNPARATASAGVLLSLLGKRQVGTQPLRTGASADGTPTFSTVFADTDRSRLQTVPMSFINVYLSGSRRRNLNLSLGVGVNPNSGKNEVEYFAGPALGLGNIRLHLGIHVGRFQELGGGFRIGEPVPANFPATPVDRRYTAHPGFALSYKIPLP